MQRWRRRESKRSRIEKKLKHYSMGRRMKALLKRITDLLRAGKMMTMLTLMILCLEMI